jgi:chorismate dehydratase
MSETPAANPAATPAPTPAPKAAAPAVASATPAPTAAPAAAAPAAAAPVTVAAPPAPAVPVKFIAKPMNIGVAPFLNSQPLIWDMKNHHKLFNVAPAEMVKLLKEGRLDVALAPIVVKFLNPELQVVPVAAIGSKGPVKSVRLLGNAPWRIMQRIYADKRSQTSVLLARLILKKWYGAKDVEVKTVDMETFRVAGIKPWEAVLQFGDIALETPPSGMEVLDLGAEWAMRTQKPFVYAVWLARDVQVARDIEMDLLASKNEGVKHFQEIVDNYHGIWVFHKPQAKEYLEKNIDYAYTPKEVQGQMEFQRLLKEEGFII